MIWVVLVKGRPRGLASAPNHLVVVVMEVFELELVLTVGLIRVVVLDIVLEVVQLEARGDSCRLLLRKGCPGYLAHVIDTQVNGLRLEDIPVVQEFPDVFLEDLPRLPSHREIEFTIELFSRTNPISQAPYRMTPAELRN
ncbi:hypothetical protein L3X38_028011 [Prunus dulcis]|uniref:Uncharacterized protein n=1 Tax=Prunus dulcis TaxID=3755 RepID=A0AAD4Z114_PRUDU|nr:hypothetical protein L3X38_028011 [Prunus dulcis]